MNRAVRATNREGVTRLLCGECGWYLAVVTPPENVPGWPTWPDGRPYDLEWSQHWTDRAVAGVLVYGRARRAASQTMTGPHRDTRYFPDAERVRCPKCREILLLQ